MAKLNENLYTELSIARSDTDKSPSFAKAKAGNYRKGKIRIHGFLITIENPKGSYRRGKDKNGHEWKTLMHNDYGYFNRTVGKDGDAIDVFLGPNLNSKKIFPIDQFLNGQFDETKVMLGFNTAEEAKAAYLSNYEKDWKGFKYITEVGMDIFKKWLYDGYRQRKPFAKYVRLDEEWHPVYDVYEEYTVSDLLVEFLRDKDEGITQKRWNLIPAQQYHNLLKRYMAEPTMARIPKNIVQNWFENIIMRNAVSIEYITQLAGHSQCFPGDDVEAVFGTDSEDGYIDYGNGWEILDNAGFYDWCKLPDGSDGWSDYGISPIFKVISEYDASMEGGEILILINRVLDIAHCRGDLASAFIEGGSHSCDIISHSLNENKMKQFTIISATNPMLDDYHVGIRSTNDIKTFEEAMAEAKSDFEEYGYYSSYPDTPNSVLENALKTGKITVYSSKPIVNGNFVTTSKMCAKDYAGGGKIYAETLPTSDIAWINVEEGQVAKVNKLNESPDNCGEHDYMDSDSFSFLKVDGKYYISEPGQNHEELFNELISDGIVDEKGIKDKSLIWNTTGRYWEDDNILSFWDTPLGDELPVMREVVNFLSSQRGIQVDPATLLIDIWDIQSINECLIPYRWFNNGTFDALFDILQDVSQYDKDTFCVKTKKGTYYVDWAGNIMSTAEFYGKYSQVSESKKQRKNDKGEVVPEKCECGGKVCVQIHGEPVFICKDCGKYYGTLPFVNEHIDIKKALKNLKKRRDPDNIENWNEDMSDKKISENVNELSPNLLQHAADKARGLNRYSQADNLEAGADAAAGSEFNEPNKVKATPRAISYINGKYACTITNEGNYGTKSANYFADVTNEHGTISDFSFPRVLKTSDKALARKLAMWWSKYGKGKQLSLADWHTYFDFAAINEIKKVNPPKDVVAAIAKGNRDADIEAHGKSTDFRTTITKNPKAYTRKVKHKKPIAEGRKVHLTEEQFKAYCRQILREKRNEDYLKEIIKESLNK